MQCVKTGTDLVFLPLFQGLSLIELLLYNSLIFSSLQDLIRDCWEQDPRYRPPFSSILKRLNLVIIDCALEDQNANMFWKMNFPQQHEVSWTQFSNQLSQFLGIDWKDNDPSEANYMNLVFSCLKFLIVSKEASLSGEVVSIERFGQIVSWFGPIDDRNRVNFLHKVDIYWLMIS